MRAAVSVARRLSDSRDAEIRNVVEGYRPEAEVVAAAEKAFNEWWSRHDELTRLRMDGFALWRAYKAGWLSMARELGQLPGGAA